MLMWFQKLAVAVVPVIGFCGDIDMTRLKISETEVLCTQNYPDL